MNLRKADNLAHLVWNGPGGQGQRTFAKMRQLAGLVLAGETAQERISEALGVSADEYADHWQKYANAMAGLSQ